MIRRWMACDWYMLSKWIVDVCAQSVHTMCTRYAWLANGSSMIRKWLVDDWWGIRRWFVADCVQGVRNVCTRDVWSVGDSWMIRGWFVDAWSMISRWFVDDLAKSVHTVKLRTWTGPSERGVIPPPSPTLPSSRGVSWARSFCCRT